ncbi:MAG: SCO family protein [Phycisphaeraceae bacterium]|nr:SCO family protein [Phycisphaeraceae bacterium]
MATLTDTMLALVRGSFADRRRPENARRVAAWLLGAVCAGAIISTATAQRTGSGYKPPRVSAHGTPEELEGVDIDVTKLGAQVPLDLPFVDDHGRPVTLREVLRPDRPAILQLGYLRCPMLCSLVLNRLVAGLQGVDWSAGDQFDVISVSINPEEKHDLAAAKKAGYVIEYGRPQSANGWHFLTGPESSSRGLADAVGFGFRLQPDGEYAHAACLFVLTPDGRVSRQLYGADQKPSTLRMALLEASGGTIGTIVDRFILWCHVYDPDRATYAWFAFRFMQIGGVVTLLGIVAGVVWMQWISTRRERSTPSITPPFDAGPKS